MKSFQRWKFMPERRCRACLWSVTRNKCKGQAIKSESVWRSTRSLCLEYWRHAVLSWASFWLLSETVGKYFVAILLSISRVIVRFLFFSGHPSGWGKRKSSTTSMTRTPRIWSSSQCLLIGLHLVILRMRWTDQIISFSSSLWTMISGKLILSWFHLDRLCSSSAFNVSCIVLLL